MKKIIIFVFTAILFFIPFSLLANVNPVPSFTHSDWYIKQFDTSIAVYKDSSLLITEKIVADAGNLPHKHGIFRTLSTQARTPSKTLKTPIELVSITDFSGRSLKYKTIKDKANHTITWKIGDPNREVNGLNYYKIVYKVKNAIRFGNPNSDEFYWNLLGNFWDLDIDNFKATIIFPDSITKNNTKINYYTGYLGQRRKDLANYLWINKNKLQFISTRIIHRREGITLSAAFPKGVFVPYKFSFIEKYGNYFWFLAPLIVFVCLFLIWLKYGRDLKINKTIIPWFEIPGNLSPMEIGLIISGGKWSRKIIPASIINMAVKGFISIQEIKPSDVITKLVEDIFHRKDFLLKKLSSKEQDENLPIGEKALMKEIFDNKKEVTLSYLRSNLTEESFSDIEEKAVDDLVNRQLIIKAGLTFQKIFSFLGKLLVFFGIFFSIILIYEFSLSCFIALFFSALLVIIFSIVMPKRTKKGAEFLWKIKGFKLYMETAEKYRQQFYEKENIFEKFLPYAIVFGITKLWLKKIGEIYGPDFIKNYQPVWFIGAAGFSSFDSFTSSIESVSSGISSRVGTSVGTSSGIGGGGFSGGGSGGGGGGGW